MPLKILLADDSMTAQKMGKEILTGAGYEVIAVSNGAAAAKKLAEKPDICILDIIMPGYTGVEVCERIRNSMETAKMPVLLTVGKMEHFDQKDVQRVAADGVIIKPFEATDLLAAVQKFAEQLSAPPKAAAAAAVASYDKTMIFTPPAVEEFKDDSYNQWKSEAEVHDDATGEVPAAKKAIEVPADLAAAPAFFDTEPSEPAAPAGAADLSGTSRDKTVLITPPDFASISAAAAAPAIEVAAPPPVDETSPSMPAFDMSAAQAFEPPPTMPSFEMSGAAFAPAEEPAAAPVPVIAEEHAIEFTAQAPVEVNPAIESGFEATAHAAVEVGQSQDPALVTGTEGFDSFKTTIGGAEPAPAPAADDDFEARVAAAMADFEEPKPEVHAEVEVVPEAEPAYERTQKITIPIELDTAPAYRPTEQIEVPTQIVDPPAYEATQIIAPFEDSRAVPDGMVDAALVEQMQAAVADLPSEPAPAERVESAPAPVATSAPTVEVSHQDMELAKALAAAVGAEAPPASEEHPAEVHEIAHTVRGVFDRMMPSIMDEIKRELAKRQK